MPIFSIGLAIGIIVVSNTYFWTYQPTMEDAKNQSELADLLKKEADKLPKAYARRNDAAKKVNDTVEQWRQIVATRTPSSSVATGGINMAVNAWQMTVDVRHFRNSIQQSVNNQLKMGGVKVVNGPLIPFPSDSANAVVSEFFNYPAIPFPVVIFDLGQVTVQGTYEQIKANMKAWSHMPHYLAVADGLALTGTSPILTGTYNVTIVGYIHGSTVYPTVKEGGTPAGGGGGAPAAGGGGGGGGGRGRGARGAGQ